MTARSRCCHLLVTVLALGWTVGLANPAGRQSADKSIILSVVDESGRPVTDMTAADIRVREDGVDGDVISLKRASGPLFIELLADTTPGTEPYINDMRKAFSAFVRRVTEGNPETQVSLMEFGQAAVTITPSTAAVADLEKGINTLFSKPRSGSVLLEGIIAASNNLAKRQSRRRAIVSFNMEPSDEQSAQEPKKIQDSLRRSGAQLWALSLQKGSNNNPKRDVVLNQLTKVTGGRRDIIVAQSAIEGYLKNYADTLLTQYEMVYRVSGGKQGQMVQTGTTRAGVKLHASTFPQQQ